MTIGEYMTQFAGLPIREWTADEGIKEPESVAYRISINWDEEDSDGVIWTDKFSEFLEDPNVGKVVAMVVGGWGPQAVAEGAEGAVDIVEAFVAGREKLTNLRAIFFGDITFEDCEISWIWQTNVAPILQAYPNLTHFGVRGAQNLSLGNLRHNNLKWLTVETGGLPVEVVREVANAQLPELEHLELWLGSDGYGADFRMEDLAPIIQAKQFPKLKYLGLRDSEMSDDIAKALVSSPVMERIRILDLSMGIISDVGGEALLSCPHIRKLEKLDLHHNYFSESMLKRLSELGIEVNLEENEDADEDDRYVSVGE